MWLIPLWEVLLQASASRNWKLCIIPCLAFSSAAGTGPGTTTSPPQVPGLGSHPALTSTATVGCRSGTGEWGLATGRARAQVPGWKCGLSLQQQQPKLRRALQNLPMAARDWILPGLFELRWFCDLYHGTSLVFLFLSVPLSSAGWQCTGPRGPGMATPPPSPWAPTQPFPWEPQRPCLSPPHCIAQAQFPRGQGTSLPFQVSLSYSQGLTALEGKAAGPGLPLGLSPVVFPLHCRNPVFRIQGRKKSHWAVQWALHPGYTCAVPICPRTSCALAGPSHPIQELHKLGAEQPMCTALLYTASIHQTCNFIMEYYQAAQAWLIICKPMFIVSSHCHVPCVFRKVFQVYLLYHLPKDVGVTDWLLVPQIFLLPLHESRNGICFLLVFRNLIWSPWPFKNNWEWPCNYANQLLWFL